MKTYTLVNDNDGNDTFQVEAETTEDAALAALEILGWNLCESKEDEE